MFMAINELCLILSISFYGISTGLSHFSKKYSTFESFVYRRKSSLLAVNRLRLAQDIGMVSFNTDFFEKKLKKINDFYNVLEKK